MELYHMNSAYSVVQSLYGLEPNPSDYEDLAMTAWELIGNKHTRLYRYVADTENKEIELPCNVTDIESVNIPVVDAQYTSSTSSYLNTDAIYIENYIDAWKTFEDPFNQKGKYVKYKEGGNKLYFTRDYKKVSIIYHGIIVDEEDGLPMINHREIKAIAAFIAYTEMYKDGIKKRDKNTIAIAQDLKADWLRKCNAARIVDHLTQNDMNSILDVKTRSDRKVFGKSLHPIL